MDSEIKAQLTQLAFDRSIPFCYGFYMEAPAGRCNSCGSDDLMRLVRGVGCEWGTERVIREILDAELSAIDLEEAFENSVRDCYSETTQVGWMKLNTVSTIKEMDPTSWAIARSEWVDQGVENESLITVDGGTCFFGFMKLKHFLRSCIKTLFHVFDNRPSTGRGQIIFNCQLW